MLGKSEQVTYEAGSWGNRRCETVIPNFNLTKGMNQHLGREVPELPVSHSSAWLIKSPILKTLLNPLASASLLINWKHIELHSQQKPIEDSGPP